MESIRRNGWLRAAGGIGAAVVTLLIARRPVARRVGRVMLAAVAAFGIGTIALGATRTYAVAFAAMAVLSGADAISVFIRSTLVPLATPFDTRPRRRKRLHRRVERAGRIRIGRRRTTHRDGSRRHPRRRGNARHRRRVLRRLSGPEGARPLSGSL
jgi:hypothetical protein